MAVPHLRQKGQVLAFFAVALPAVLLPAAAYAVDASFAAQRYGELEAATVLAAEAAADRLDTTSFRQNGALSIDPAGATLVARHVLVEQAPTARLVSVDVAGDRVEVTTRAAVDLPLPLLARTITLTARAAARLVPGYDSPSSRLPLPVSSL